MNASIFIFIFIFLRVPVIPFRAASIQLIFMYLIFPIHLSASNAWQICFGMPIYHSFLDFFFQITRLYESSKEEKQKKKKINENKKVDLNIIS